jgi:SAM-dependent methyltransferase
METWHENDAFWKTMAAAMFDEQRWDAAPGQVDLIKRLLGVNPGSRIRDLGCGPGRHARALARRGFDVTGVDRTAAYLEEARARAIREDLVIEFVQEDMRRFCRPNTFDAALSMFTSFGYFEDPAENRQVLVNVNRSLKDTGVLILELMGKEILARIFTERDWSEQEGGFLLQERKLGKNWSWMENRWILLQGAEQHEFKISHWLYSASELTMMLMGCGFGAVDIFGDLEGAPYDHTARRLVAIARKV